MFQNLKTRIAVVPVALMTAAGAARAELPAEVGTAISEFKTDALAAIGLVIVAGVAIWGLKKLGTKMGWF